MSSAAGTHTDLSAQTLLLAWGLRGLASVWWASSGGSGQPAQGSRSSQAGTWLSVLPEPSRAFLARWTDGGGLNLASLPGAPPFGLVGSGCCPVAGIYDVFDFLCLNSHVVSHTCNGHRHDGAPEPLHFTRLCFLQVVSCFVSFQ